jgi:uncharacterized coiled-coil protein SlyX
MSNRVEELESQVAELQAAVDGLTEELVETRERLRQLEADDGVDNSRTPERRESAHAQVEHADTEPAPAPDPEPADADAEPEPDRTTEAEAEDDDSDSDGNDIIVA